MDHTKPHSVETKHPVAIFRKLAFRFLLYFLLFLIFVAGIGVLALQSTYFQNRLRAVIEESTSHQINGSIHIGKLSGSLLSDITLNDIRLNDSNNTTLLSIESLSLRYFLPKAFFKIIYFKDVDLKGLRLNLAKSSSGEWNISSLFKSPDEAGADAPSFPYLLQIIHADLADLQINMHEPGSNDKNAAYLTVHRFVAGIEYDRSMRISILDSSLTFNRPTPFPVSLFGELIFSPATSDMTLQQFIIKSGDASLVVNGDGRFSETLPVFNVSLAAEHVNVSEISKKYSLSGFPESLLSGVITVSGTPEDFKHDISLMVDDAAIKINGSSGFDNERGLWSNLSASVRRLDLSKGWFHLDDILSGVVSTDIHLNATRLQSLAEKADAKASIDISGLLASGVPIDNVRLGASWSNGILSINRFQAVSGQNDLDLSGTLAPKTHQTKLNFKVNLLDAETLLTHLSISLPQIFDDVAVKGETQLALSLEGEYDLPSARFYVISHDVSAKTYHADTLDMHGLWLGLPGPDHRIDDIALTLQGISGDRLKISDFTLKGTWSGWLDDPVARFSTTAKGVEALSYRADRLDLDGNWSGRTDDSQSAFSVIARNLSSDSGTLESLKFSGRLHGLPNTVDAATDVRLLVEGLRMENISTPVLNLSANWQGPFSSFSGETSIETEGATIYGHLFSKIMVGGRITPDHTNVNLFADLEQGGHFELAGKVGSWKTDQKEITIDQLLLATTAPLQESTLTNTAPVQLTFRDSGLTLHDCHLDINDASLSLSGDIHPNGEQNLNLQVDKLQIGRLPGGWNDKAGLSGIVSANATLHGSWDRPVIASRVNAKDLSGYGIAQTTDFSATVDYKDPGASFHATLSKQGTLIFSASGTVPLSLSLSPFSAKTQAGDLKATLQTRDLKFSELPIPKIRDLEWDAVADINLAFAGSPQSPEISGNILIHDGYLNLLRKKLTYETLDGKIFLANNRVKIEKLHIEGDREGRLLSEGTILIQDGHRLDADLRLSGNNFYLPFQRAISARISPKLHLSGGIQNPRLTGEVTISESKIDLDKISRQRHSEIQVVESSSPGSDTPMLVASQSQGPEYLSPLYADILVHVPKNAWLKGQGVNAEISGEIAITKKPGGPFLLTGPLNTLRGNYYFMGKNFQLTKGNVEFLGLKEVNPNLNIEARTRVKSSTIIVILSGTAQEMTVDLSSDPEMDESDIISYLVFGRASEDLGGDQAFSVQKTAMNYVGGLLAGELRTLLGDTALIDSFSIESGSDGNGFGAVTLGKYVTPEIFISRRQGLSENDPSYQEITYELTPDIKLETQIGRDYTNSADITWEFDF